MNGTLDHIKYCHLCNATCYAVLVVWKLLKFYVYFVRYHETVCVCGMQAEGYYISIEYVCGHEMVFFCVCMFISFYSMCNCAHTF